MCMNDGTFLLLQDVSQHIPSQRTHCMTNAKIITMHGLGPLAVIKADLLRIFGCLLWFRVLALDTEAQTWAIADLLSMLMQVADAQALPGLEL